MQLKISTYNINVYKRKSFWGTRKRGFSLSNAIITSYDGRHIEILADIAFDNLKLDRRKALYFQIEGT